MIIKNLHPAYNSRLLSSPISFFGELCDCGTRIEDAINNGQLEKGESKLPIKKTYGGGITTSKAPNPMSVSAIIPQQTLAYPSFTKKAHREFFNLGMTLAQTYENFLLKDSSSLLILHPCLTLYLPLGISMKIAISTKNSAIGPTIVSASNIKYKTS